MGIDAAITARHHVAVRSDGGETTKRFSVEPTLAGLRTLTDRLIGYDNIDAVVEPTSMTWLALTMCTFANLATNSLNRVCSGDEPKETISFTSPNAKPKSVESSGSSRGHRT
ncbi:hypothetical protein [Mycolicibacterium sp.]|uniref:hypothetical protein n=1 Tax=Mycolicibacterium sp. TaxID=2320850 RepID=UPI0028AAF167|nr:hypothetical protein [Mycolicibacterium sp.]